MVPRGSNHNRLLQYLNRWRNQVAFPLVCIGLLLLVFSYSLLRSDDHTTVKNMDEFVLFGDSITQGSFSQERGFAMGAALQHDYVRRLDIIARGFSGYNTEQALRVFPHCIPKPSSSKMRAITIWLGANDARLPDTGVPAQTVPLDTYKNNLRTLATHSSVKEHNPKIILITPPPVNEYALEVHDRAKGINFPRRVADNTARYADAVREIGKELQLPVVDVWSAFMKEAGWKQGEPLIGSKAVPQSDVFLSLMYDGLHLGPAGYAVVYNELKKVIREQLPDLEPEKLPMLGPLWDDNDAWAALKQ